MTDSSPRRHTLLWALASAALLALALDMIWIEPHQLLVEDTVHLHLARHPLRLVHLSDLHISQDRPLLRRLLGEVAAAAPDAIVISGDLIRDEPDGDVSEHTAAAAAFISQLRRVAPIYGVQGHSDYLGEEIESLAHAGITWLSNEGRLLGGDGGVLLLGVNQQVGYDSLAAAWRSPFRAVRLSGQWLHVARRGDVNRNYYSHYDPTPSSLTDVSGPLSWSGYDAVCDVRIDHRDVAAGLEVHSRYVTGEDRMLRLRRNSPDNGAGGTFALVSQGSAFTGGSRDHLDTGVDPEPGVWYRMRLHTDVTPDAVLVKARVWPLEKPEPAAWQAVAEDRSSDRVAAGTVGLWAWGGGTVIYRNLRVTGNDGTLLLTDPLAGPERPPGWRDGARATRLALALARSPVVPPGTPRLVLSHIPDIVLEASQRGIDAVLAGHTHGGQVRLPGLGALTTRDALGPFYDLGRFEFAAPNPRGLTTLYVNAGFGTSLLPIRFLCPPRWALIELGPPRQTT
jgi:predicted MPP superfamily phosphohydrolase